MNKQTAAAIGSAIAGGSLGALVAGISNLWDVSRLEDDDEDAEKDNVIKIRLRNMLKGKKKYEEELEREKAQSDAKAIPAPAERLMIEAPRSDGDKSDSESVKSAQFLLGWLPDSQNVGAALASGVGSFALTNYIIKKLIRRSEKHRLENAQEEYIEAVNKDNQDSYTEQAEPSSYMWKRSSVKCAQRQGDISKIIGYSLIAGGTSAIVSALLVGRILKNRADEAKALGNSSYSKFPKRKNVIFSVES